MGASSSTLDDDVFCCTGSRSASRDRAAVISKGLILRSGLQPPHKPEVRSKTHASASSTGDWSVHTPEIQVRRGIQGDHPRDSLFDPMRSHEMEDVKGGVLQPY